MAEKITDKSSLSFEDSLEGLEKAVGALKNESTTLDMTMKNYEDGMAYYTRCEELLSAARQRIMILSKDGEAREVRKEVQDERL
ncbi:MAG: exodeoxyribonuclease VII small subunit [Clostridiales Family XIII bacterium]|nr:exodeoxyribonuclease VII small subunit [Clostridiales Family XIII bacterium]